jgi:hypothetical protein
MLLMLLPDDTCEFARRPARPLVPFEVVLALVVLTLCLLYGLVFGHMLYVSLMEQVNASHAHLPGSDGRPHFHNPVEWLLLVLPAVIAWSGTISSLRYLGRRWLAR